MPTEVCIADMSDTQLHGTIGVLEALLTAPAGIGSAAAQMLAMCHSERAERIARKSRLSRLTTTDRVSDR